MCGLSISNTAQLTMSFELLDDQLARAVLEDALAYIDAYEHSASASVNADTTAFAPAPAPAMVSLPSSTAATARTATSSAKKQAKKQKDPDLKGTLRSRNRPRGSDVKLELECLRHDVKLLEARLAHVKSDAFGSPGSVSSTSSSISSEEETPDARNKSQRALVTAWRSVALRQFQRRSQSEMTNRKLKQVLAKQLKLAKTLEALYSKRPSQSVSGIAALDGSASADFVLLSAIRRIWSSCTALQYYTATNPLSATTIPFRL